MLAAGRESVIVDWPDGTDPASWLAATGEAGLVAVTRKGCLESPPGQVRPHHVGRLITQADAATIPSERDGKRTAGLRRVVENVNLHSSELTAAAAERYCQTAAPVLAPIIVDLAIEISTDTYGDVDQVVETIAAWATRLPAPTRQTFARYAADTLESRDLGAAGWLERKLHAAIEVRTYNQAGDGTDVGWSADYDLGPVG
ncbi:MAG: hypothetical protein M3Y91_18955 [Actinomycetota bacterium]|nr:hypothetical protein [Actinomycetota bacterium]